MCNMIDTELLRGIVVLCRSEDEKATAIKLFQSIGYKPYPNISPSTYNQFPFVHIDDVNRVTASMNTAEFLSIYSVISIEELTAMVNGEYAAEISAESLDDIL